MEISVLLHIFSRGGKGKYGIIIRNTAAANEEQEDTKKELLKSIFAVLFLLPVCANATVNSNSIIEDDIEYYIQTDKPIYNLGENVEMLFRVTNLRDTAITIPCSRSGEFNFLVEKNDETIWAAAHWFTWFSPGVELSAGESKNVPYIWDMIDDNDNLVELGIYDVIGVMYNEPWNYDNHGNYIPTEVAVPITIVPEPATLLLFVLGAAFLRKPKK